MTADDPTFTPEQEQELLKSGPGGGFAVGYARALDREDSAYRHRGFFGSNTFWMVMVYSGILLGAVAGYFLGKGWV